MENLMELSEIERNRMFNQGYYTWVEQQGISIENFEKRRNPEFWREKCREIDKWEIRIKELNNI